MLRQSRVFKVFISSTFKDFQAERNALQAKVWPKLKELCESKGCRFQAIDLRWGIPPEAGDERLTTKMCMEELRHCQESNPRPNIIVLLGNRYGWRPIPEEIPDTEFKLLAAEDAELLNQYYERDDNAVPSTWIRRPRVVSTDPILQNELDKEDSLAEELLRKTLSKIVQALPDDRRVVYERSVTEQEILAGAMGPNAGGAFAYTREIDESSLVAMIRGRNLEVESFTDVIRNSDDTFSFDAEAKLLLKDLKQRVDEQFGTNPSRRFEAQFEDDGELSINHIEKFCNQVLKDLGDSMVTEFKRLDNSDPLNIEINAHQTFGRSLAEKCIDRAEQLDWITQQFQDSNHHGIVVLSGATGIGKSTIMARAALELQKAAPRTIVVQRFVGATANANNVTAVLVSICSEIAREFGENWTIPESRAQITRTFNSLLGLATGARKIAIFLDGLDQIGGEDLRSIDWLPEELPDKVKIVVSASHSPNGSIDTLLALLRLRSIAELEIDSVSTDAADRLLDILLGPHRRLSDAQRSKVMTAYERCPRPLYLKLAANEAATWRSFDKKASIASGDGDTGLEVIIGQLFDRLCAPQNHIGGLAERAISYLVADRSGLTEDELLEVVSKDREFFAEFEQAAEKAKQKLPEGTNQIPDSVWARMMSDLRPHLVERITIYPNWSEAERRDRLCVGLSRFAVSELCGFYAFRFSWL